MPTSKKTKNITLRVGVFKALKSRHRTEIENHPTRTKSEFAGFVNDILEDVIEKQNFLYTAYPNFSTIDVSEDVLYITDDTTENGRVGIYLKKGQLYCDYHDSNSCDHIRYAFCTPEIAKLKLKKPLATTMK